MIKQPAGQITNRLFFRRERNQITGAWIEIDYNKWSDRGYAVAPRKGRVD